MLRQQDIDQKTMFLNLFFFFNFTTYLNSHTIRKNQNQNGEYLRKITDNLSPALLLQIHSKMDFYFFFFTRFTVKTSVFMEIFTVKTVGNQIASRFCCNPLPSFFNSVVKIPRHRLYWLKKTIKEVLFFVIYLKTQKKLQSQNQNNLV